LKVELKIECKNYWPVETRFTIYVNTISAFINGGEWGQFFIFQKDFGKLLIGRGLDET